MSRKGMCHEAGGPSRSCGGHLAVSARAGPGRAGRMALSESLDESGGSPGRWGRLLDSCQGDRNGGPTPPVGFLSAASCQRLSGAGGQATPPGGRPRGAQTGPQPGGYRPGRGMRDERDPRPAGPVQLLALLRLPALQ